MCAEQVPDEAEAADPLFSHWVDVSDLSKTGRQLVLTLDEPVRKRLAEAFDLVDLPMVRAEVDLRARGAGVILRFHLTAQVVQRCVVTLEPVAADVDEMVTLHYTPRAGLEETARVIVIADDDDPPPAEELDLASLARELAAQAGDFQNRDD